jgi:phospholipase/carboxylesterase
MHELELAGIETRVVGTPGRPRAAVVLFHGFGVPGDDLVYLSRELSLGGNTWLVLPAGLLDLGEQLDASCTGKRGWWSADSRRLKLALLTGQVQLAARAAGDQRASARHRIAEFFTALQAELGLASNRIVLGGFSQGAILSLDFLLHDPRTWAGLAFLSGTLVDLAELRLLAGERAGTRALVSHGRLDPYLPFPLARQLNDELVQAGWIVTFLPFEGRHSIPGDVCSRLSTFVLACMGNDASASVCVQGGSNDDSA